MEETKIFISYAHKDDAYFRVFKEGIESHSKSSKKLKWKIWCDKKIPTGSLWHNAIKEEIKTCHAAILLVSANFLSSNYIENEEFLHFLERTEKEGFIFLPILLSDCDFTQWEKLSERQFFNPQGQDFGVEKFKHKIVPYNYIEKEYYRDSYHKDCVKAFEKVILSKQNTQQNLISKDNNPSLTSVLSYIKQLDEEEKMSEKETKESLRAFFDTLNNEDRREWIKELLDTYFKDKHYEDLARLSNNVNTCAMSFRNDDFEIQVTGKVANEVKDVSNHLLKQASSYHFDKTVKEKLKKLTRK